MYQRYPQAIAVERIPGLFRERIPAFDLTANFVDLVRR
jgi:hypothetical protein